MKLVMLDRDGVINQDGPDHVRTPEEWVPLAGSLEAIARLSQAGYQVVVVTNQSGIARKYFSVETLHAIHQKMHEAVALCGGRIEAVYYCPHGPWEDCDCRKPKPGMLKNIERRLSISSWHDVPMVGDAARDLQAAMAVGARPVLVRTGKGEQTLADNKGFQQQVPVFNNLADFVDDFLSEKK